MAQYPGFLRLTNLEIHAGRLFAFLICQQIVSFGSHQSFTVPILGDFSHFLSALPSNNRFIIKLVKMWPGGTSHVVVGTLHEGYSRDDICKVLKISSEELESESLSEMTKTIQSFQLYKRPTHIFQEASRVFTF